MNRRSFLGHSGLMTLSLSTRRLALSGVSSRLMAAAGAEPLCATGAAEELLPLPRAQLLAVINVTARSVATTGKLFINLSLIKPFYLLLVALFYRGF